MNLDLGPNLPEMNCNWKWIVDQIALYDILADLVNCW